MFDYKIHPLGSKKEGAFDGHFDDVLEETRGQFHQHVYICAAFTG